MNTPPWTFVPDPAERLCEHVQYGACYICRREHPRPTDVHEPVDYQDARVMAVDGLDVVSWHPQAGGLGRPTQVHILLTPPGGADGRMALRLKSKRAVDALISALEVHRNDVWPPE